MATTYTDGSAVSGISGTMTETSILGVIMERIHPHGAHINSITEELKNVLVEMTSRDDVDFLRTTSSPTVSDGTTSFAKPANFKKLISLEIEDYGTLDRIGFNLYQDRVNFYTDYEGEPHEFAEYGSNIYLWPTADQSYTATLYYAYIHPYSTSTIYLDDDLREAVYNGVMAHLYRGKLSRIDGSKGLAEYYSAIYEREILSKMSLYENWQPRRIEYRNL